MLSQHCSRGQARAGQVHLEAIDLEPPEHAHSFSVVHTSMDLMIKCLLLRCLAAPTDMWNDMRWLQVQVSSGLCMGMIIRDHASIFLLTSYCFCCSVGSHVRDAAGYVCWAFARAYSSEVMQSSLLALAPSLLVAACYDREVSPCCTCSHKLRGLWITRDCSRKSMQHAASTGAHLI